MRKVKLKGEYFIDLLDNKKGSVRKERKEKGFELRDDDDPPDFAKDDANLWTEGTYDKNLEGWEKLCVEAYLCGWVDYFDRIVEKVPEDYRTIYFKWAHDNSTSLKVYIIPTPNAAGASVPKPPPPPVG
jgi:hypothetical protein